MRTGCGHSELITDQEREVSPTSMILDNVNGAIPPNPPVPYMNRPCRCNCSPLVV
jgi:hypothetical protein